MFFTRGRASSNSWQETSSPSLGRSIALALVKEGIKKKGLTIYAPMPNKTIEVEITDPVFIDPNKIYSEKFLTNCSKIPGPCRSHPEYLFELNDTVHYERR